MTQSDSDTTIRKITARGKGLKACSESKSERKPNLN